MAVISVRIDRGVVLIDMKIDVKTIAVGRALVPSEVATTIIIQFTVFLSNKALDI